MLHPDWVPSKLNPLTGKSESFVKNSDHLIQFFKSVTFKAQIPLSASMSLVLSLIYQLTKPYKSSEINSMTIAHWWNGSPCKSKTPWNYWKFV
jgi:hypothetical protein